MKVLAFDSTDEVGALVCSLTVEDRLKETVVSVWTKDVMVLEVEAVNEVAVPVDEVAYGVDVLVDSVSVHSVQTSLDDQEELVTYGVEVLVDSVSVHSVQTSLDDEKELV